MCAFPSSATETSWSPADSWKQLFGVCEEKLKILMISPKHVQHEANAGISWKAGDILCTPVFVVKRERKSRQTGPPVWAAADLGIDLSLRLRRRGWASFVFLCVSVRMPALLHVRISILLLLDASRSEMDGRTTDQTICEWRRRSLDWLSHHAPLLWHDLRQSDCGF